MKFLAAVNQYGLKASTMISQYIGSRSVTQVANFKRRYAEKDKRTGHTVIPIQFTSTKTDTEQGDWDDVGQSGQGQSSKLVEHAIAPGVLEGGEMRGEKGTVNLPGRGWGSGEEQPSGLVELVTTPEDLEGGMLRGVVEIISMPGPGVGACMNPSVGVEAGDPVA